MHISSVSARLVQKGNAIPARRVLIGIVVCDIEHRQGSPSSDIKRRQKNMRPKQVTREMMV
jgi:hypothetical protein